MFGPLEMIKLKCLSKFFKPRVTMWTKMVYITPRTRLSQVASINEKSVTVFEFPTQAEIAKMLAAGVRPFLVGFENSRQNGLVGHFNFVLSNGLRSTQRDNGFTYYDYMVVPFDALEKIRQV